MNNVQLKRLTIIHNAIKDQKYPNNPRLRAMIAEAMRLDPDEVPSEATINRDIKELRDNYQAPIEWSYGHKGYYYSDSKWNFSIKPLNSNDLVFFGLFKSMMENYRGTPIYNNIDLIIQYIMKSYGAKGDDILKRITVAPTPKVAIENSMWEALWVAMEENQVVEFDYTSQWRGENIHHRVHPYQIMLGEGMYYLWGYDVLSKYSELRLFNFPLISNLELTADHFDLPEDFEFIKRTGGGNMGAWFGDSISEYVIKFTGISRNYIKNRTWAEEQVIEDHPDEDYAIIRFKSAQWGPVQQWILSMGPEAQPLAPGWLVAWWKEQIRKMSRLAAE